MSHHFQRHLSPAARAWTRHLDTVRVTDALDFELWTYDMDLGADFSEPCSGSGSGGSGGSGGPDSYRSSGGGGGGELAGRISEAAPILRQRRRSLAPPEGGGAAAERARRSVAGAGLLSSAEARRKTRAILGAEAHGAAAAGAPVPVPPVVTFPPAPVQGGGGGGGSGRDGIGGGGGRAAAVGRGSYHPALWGEDSDLRLLRRRMEAPGLREAWAGAAGLYHAGRWAEARAALLAFQAAYARANVALGLPPGLRDGPADFLLGFMESHRTPEGGLLDDPGHARFGRVPHPA